MDEVSVEDAINTIVETTIAPPLAERGFSRRGYDWTLSERDSARYVHVTATILDGGEILNTAETWGTVKVEVGVWYRLPGFLDQPPDSAIGCRELMNIGRLLPGLAACVFVGEPPNDVLANGTITPQAFARQWPEYVLPWLTAVADPGRLRDWYAENGELGSASRMNKALRPEEDTERELS